MSEDSKESANCPTCPDGRCPSINTTPHYPEPDAGRIASAELAITDALAVSFFPLHARCEAPAWKLIEEVIKPKYGKHSLPSIYWAIHRLIQKQMLSVHAHKMPVIGPNDDPPKTGVWFKRGPVRGFAWHEYSDEPAQYSTFVVRAEESLWQWYRSQDSRPRNFGQSTNLAAPATEGEEGDRRIYRPDDLLKELGIATTNTLNKYAKRAHVKTPRRGQRDHQYTESERQRILKHIAEDNKAPSSLAKKARELLAETETKSNGNRKISRRS